MFSRLEDFRVARWAKSLNRSVQILFALTLVAGLNILAATHYLRWDLTANHRFSLSPETLSFLGNIPRDPAKPVKVSFILPENQSDDSTRVTTEQIRSLLNEYAYEAKHLSEKYGGPVPLTIEEIDPQRQIDKLKALQAIDGYSPYAQIMVVYDGRGQALTMADLYDTQAKNRAGDSAGAAATAFKGENAITSAILNVVQTKQDQVLFTIGHGEMRVWNPDPTNGLSNMGIFLKARNYSMGEIDLAKDDQKLNDAKLVVVASPLVAFQPYEVEKLRRYLNDKNGRVLIFLEPGDANGLDGLLAEWGLRSHDWIISDPQNPMPDGQMAISPSMDDKQVSELTQFLAMSGLSVVLGPTRPVEVDDDAPADDRRQIHEVLATSRAAYAVTTIDHDERVNNPVHIPGPFMVAALSERRSTDAVGLPGGGRLLVFGNADFIANRNFNNYGNPYLILNCVNYLANRENMLNIPPKAPLQTQLDITSAQFTGLAWRLAVVPAVVALLGLVVFWVRNRT